MEHDNQTPYVDGDLATPNQQGAMSRADGSVDDTGGVAHRGDIRMLSSSAFESLVLEGAGPIAVEFMSYGCAHCRVLEPILQQVAVLVKQTEKIFQVNVAAHPDLAAQLGIQGTPTFVMFLDGQEVGRASGPSPNLASLLAVVTEPFE